jgi:hypothetical protein
LARIPLRGVTRLLSVRCIFEMACRSGFKDEEFQHVSRNSIKNYKNKK